MTSSAASAAASTCLWHRHSTCWLCGVQDWRRTPQGLPTLLYYRYSSLDCNNKHRLRSTLKWSTLNYLRIYFAFSFWNQDFMTYTLFFAEQGNNCDFQCSNSLTTSTFYLFKILGRLRLNFDKNVDIRTCSF